MSRGSWAGDYIRDTDTSDYEPTSQTVEDINTVANETLSTVQESVPSPENVISSIDIGIPLWLKGGVVLLVFSAVSYAVGQLFNINVGD